MDQKATGSRLCSITPVPAILHANRESRDARLKHYKLEFGCEHHTFFSRGTQHPTEIYTKPSMPTIYANDKVDQIYYTPQSLCNAWHSAIANHLRKNNARTVGVNIGHCRDEIAPFYLVEGFYILHNSGVSEILIFDEDMSAWKRMAKGEDFKVADKGYVAPDIRSYLASRQRNLKQNIQQLHSSFTESGDVRPFSSLDHVYFAWHERFRGLVKSNRLEEGKMPTIKVCEQKGLH
ncbi:hypothetical protein G7Y89_g12446 [Cudoniella acicularis]|uniref:2EXR domain-containing protein n=1 Tax=Cudoniella acicularis TaxID=354080 RepID=A0A8H4RCJ9_9HELO|nr:hypothetical protein G7Y89_g12446 [Cudoniella acicularis]